MGVRFGRLRSGRASVGESFTAVACLQPAGNLPSGPAGRLDGAGSRGTGPGGCHLPDPPKPLDQLVDGGEVDVGEGEAEVAVLARAEHGAGEAEDAVVAGEAAADVE